MSSGGGASPTWTANTILDVDHADDGVEALLRRPACGCGRPRRRRRPGRRRSVVGGHRVDVAARHGDVAGILLAEMEDVEQHLPLDMAEVADAGDLALAALDRLLDLVAERRFAVVAEDEGANAAPECCARPAPPRLSSSIGLGLHLAQLIGIGDADATRAPAAPLPPSPRHPRRSFRDRNLADGACRAPPDARHGPRPPTFLLRRLGRADAVGEDDVAEQLGAGELALRPPSGRRGRWSPCPCRATPRSAREPRRRR